VWPAGPRALAILCSTLPTVSLRHVRQRPRSAARHPCSCRRHDLIALASFMRVPSVDDSRPSVPQALWACSRTAPEAAQHGLSPRCIFAAWPDDAPGQPAAPSSHSRPSCPRRLCTGRLSRRIVLPQRTGLRLAAMPPRLHQHILRCCLAGLPPCTDRDALHLRGRQRLATRGLEQRHRLPAATAALPGTGWATQAHLHFRHHAPDSFQQGQTPARPASLPAHTLGRLRCVNRLPPTPAHKASSSSCRAGRRGVESRTGRP